LKSRFLSPLKGKNIEGELVGYKDNKIIIKKNGNELMEFERDKVALVRRVIKF